MRQCLHIPATLALTFTLLGHQAAFAQPDYGLPGLNRPRPVITPPPLGWSTLDQNRRVENLYIAGQPDAQGLQAFADIGGTLVINLRDQNEMHHLHFDESQAAQNAGLHYLSIPLSAETFSTQDVWSFADALRNAQGPALVHCATGNRAAAIVAAYQTLVKNQPLSASLAQAFSLGLHPAMSEAVRRITMTDPERIVKRIEPRNIRENIDALAAFGTRHTLSDTTSDTRGIGAARRWIKMKFEEASALSRRTGDDALRVYFDSHHVEPDGRRISQPVDIVNVVCEIPGSMPQARSRLYYMIAHYDSRATDVMDTTSDAPGANDDGSGVAALLETARVLAKERLDATVVLMATAGEEQGLYGSKLHANDLHDHNANVQAVFNNDIVGDPSGPGGLLATDQVRVFSEGIPAYAFSDESQALHTLRRIQQYASENDSPSRQLARFIAEVARIHDLPVQPKLIYRPDRFLRGGDHLPFAQLGYPAVRFTQVYEDFTHQHQNIREEDGIRYGDLPELVDAEYLADVTRLNTAALIHLANAPSPPTDPRIIVAELTTDTTLRWQPSPEPDVAGYQIVWRETTDPDWTNLKDVGPVTEFTLDMSKDNWFFGVRAYDRDGYLSPVVTPVAARQ